MNKNGLLSVVVLVGASACVSTPRTGDEMRDREYRRETARIEAQERFETLKEDCAQSSGMVVVNRTSGRIRPEADDVELASCQRSVQGAIF